MLLDEITDQVTLEFPFVSFSHFDQPSAVSAFGGGTIERRFDHGQKQRDRTMRQGRRIGFVRVCLNLAEELCRCPDDLGAHFRIRISGVGCKQIEKFCTSR